MGGGQNAGMAPFTAGSGRHEETLRSVALIGLAFAVGYTLSDLDRASGLVLAGAVGAGVLVGVGAGRGKCAASVFVGGAAAYAAGLFTSAAVDDKLNLLPCAVTFMTAFAAVFLGAAWVARRVWGKPEAEPEEDRPGDHDNGEG